MARKQVVPIRFTTEEKLQLQEFAKSRCVSLSEYVRKVVLQRKLPPPVVSQINRETYQALTRIGNNLNQLARSANEGKLVNLPKTLLEAIRGELRVAGLLALGIEPETSSGPALALCGATALGTMSAAGEVTPDDRQTK